LAAAIALADERPIRIAANPCGTEINATAISANTEKAFADFVLYIQWFLEHEIDPRGSIVL
jgi:hypothetical protein